MWHHRTARRSSGSSRRSRWPRIRSDEPDCFSRRAVPLLLFLARGAANPRTCGIIGRRGEVLDRAGGQVGRESDRMSPTVFREGPYRFFFFSREEPRIHVHVASSDGEAKFWIEPEVKLAENHGIPNHELADLLRSEERRVGKEC